METTKNITMEPYNIEYYIAKYGTVENLTKDYIGAIDGLRMQYRQYETNPRKGGRYRREKMEHLRQQAEAIYDELLRVSRAMKEYFAATPTETPQISTETAETVNVSMEGNKGAERAEITPKAKRMKSKDDITEQFERIRVTFLSMPDWDLEPIVGRIALAEDICKRYISNINQHLGLYDETEFCHYSDLEIPQSVYAAPQSPETPQTVGCTAEPCKLAQTV